MQPGFRAGSILGDMIFGKPDGKVYGDQMERNMRTAKLMEEARNARSRNLAMDEITPEKFAAAYGVSPELGSLLSSATRSQDSANLNVLGATPGDMQEYAMRKAVAEEGLPVLGAVNANLAAIDGKPLKVNAIDAGYQLNPYEAGGEAVPMLGEITDAELTRAKVGVQGALGDKYEAQAASGGFAPRAPGGRGGGSAKRSASASKQIVATLEKEMGRKLEVATKKDPAVEAAATQALKDARAAVATGRITKEEARKRLVAAGFKNTAARL